jgi:hypothetical protein
MKNFTSGAAILLIICTTSCASGNSTAGHAMLDGESVGAKHNLRVHPMNPSRLISTQNCRETIYSDGGNLLCR